MNYDATKLRLVWHFIGTISNSRIKMSLSSVETLPFSLFFFFFSSVLNEFLFDILSVAVFVIMIRDRFAKKPTCA